MSHLLGIVDEECLLSLLLLPASMDDNQHRHWERAGERSGYQTHVDLFYFDNFGKVISELVDPQLFKWQLFLYSPFKTHFGFLFDSLLLGRDIPLINLCKLLFCCLVQE